MLIKLDMSKSFNKLSCHYISEFILDFGFHSDWVQWIMTLLSFSLFFVLVNGYLSNHFHPSWGMKQGDPLSHFIFILMAEWIHHSLKAVVASPLMD